MVSLYAISKDLYSGLRQRAQAIKFWPLEGVVYSQCGQSTDNLIEAGVEGGGKPRSGHSQAWNRGANHGWSANLSKYLYKTAASEGVGRAERGISGDLK
jgi:hypothetical protein